jgi:hypothetical protein
MKKPSRVFFLGFLAVIVAQYVHAADNGITATPLEWSKLLADSETRRARQAEGALGLRSEHRRARLHRAFQIHR